MSDETIKHQYNISIHAPAKGATQTGVQRSLH